MAMAQAVTWGLSTLVITATPIVSSILLISVNKLMLIQCKRPDKFRSNPVKVYIHRLDFPHISIIKSPDVYEMNLQKC